MYTKAVTLLILQKIAFPNLALFCRLLMTIPVTSVNTECLFSTSKCIKTYLRLKTAADTLSYLCLINSEKELRINLCELSRQSLESVCYAKAQACFLYLKNCINN